MGRVPEFSSPSDGTTVRVLDIARTRLLTPSATRVINNYLFEPRHLNGLLRGNSGTLGEVRALTDQLRERGPQMRFADVLLDLVATDKDHHVSRGIVTLFQEGFVPLTAEGVSHPTVLAMFLRAANTVNTSGIDRRGAILRIGKVLGRHFVDDYTRVWEARNLLADTLLGGISPETDGDVWQTVAVGLFDIQHEIRMKNIAHPSKRILDRRKSILLSWESGMTKEQLLDMLIQGKKRITAAEFSEDLEYFANCGINVPFVVASEPVTASVVS